MADPSEAEFEPDTPEPKKNWRKELEDRAAAAENAQVEMAQKLALYESGLVELSDDQRDDVLTLAKAKGDTSPDALKAIAERLSYTKPPQAENPSAEQQGPDRSAEVAQLASLAQTTGDQFSQSQEAAVDLSKFSSHDELLGFLRNNAADIAPPGGWPVA